MIHTRERGASGSSAPTGLPNTAFALSVSTPTAIERVVISQTTIEIELAETVAGDEESRVLILPWTPPSPYRRHFG